MDEESICTAAAGIGKLQEKEEALKARQLELQNLKQAQVTKQIMEACQKCLSTLAF